MAEELTYWEKALGEEYAPKYCFELQGNVLGLAWGLRDKEVAGQLYAEFLLATLISEDGHIQHFNTYAIPKSMVKRVEPFVRRRGKVLGDLLKQLRDAFFPPEKEGPREK
jgi:hypothetical protein